MKANRSEKIHIFLAERFFTVIGGMTLGRWLGLLWGPVCHRYFLLAPYGVR